MTRWSLQGKKEPFGSQFRSSPSYLSLAARWPPMTDKVPEGKLV
jgi:hypothetical protein